MKSCAAGEDKVFGGQVFAMPKKKLLIALS